MRDKRPKGINNNNILYNIIRIIRMAGLVKNRLRLS